MVDENVVKIGVKIVVKIILKIILKIIPNIILSKGWVFLITSTNKQVVIPPSRLKNCCLSQGMQCVDMSFLIEIHISAWFWLPFIPIPITIAFW